MGISIETDLLEKFSYVLSRMINVDLDLEMNHTTLRTLKKEYILNELAVDKAFSQKLNRVNRREKENDPLLRNLIRKEKIKNNNSNYNLENAPRSRFTPFFNQRGNYRNYSEENPEKSHHVFTIKKF